MAASRERRANAGRRMANLLNEEEEDDFYKTSYGGFSETADDGDYVQKNDDEEDIVDSDFSIDENDEPISDADEEPAKGAKRRKVGTVTKAYREPAPKKPTARTKEPKPKTERQSTLRKRPKFTVIDSGRKSFRKSTAAKTAATQSRLRQRFEAERKRTRVIRTEEYIPTQEELLEEAEITERENLKSLERFRRMELEKQKTRPTKRKFMGPTIRYLSTAMPIIEEISNAAKGDTDPLNISSDAKDVDDQTKSSRDKTMKRNKKSTTRLEVTGQYERTFITFENDIDNKVFDALFPKPDNGRRLRQICAVTRLPARYYDPVTQLPYRNVQAFKILREAYYQQLEERGNVDNPEVTRWLEWRKKIKEYRVAALKKMQSAAGEKATAAGAGTTKPSVASVK
ncbi:vacuolar protein sorting-associated protein 72 homolog [Anopheles ziemanni]|uniref:vacuolar protein sorting-associated protein 72 homolog n=1 Tax=Anopheles ziemanni TaxID=345580 RepID=UPI002659F2AC|nr:vacuolar protein sorting-associated protein 72 homolog isoform X1 [Anopheles coustani]XP_058169368.1 vacuolar protein sorting-associated protein 72 homolog [Anopheles ziemanni]